MKYKPKHKEYDTTDDEMEKVPHQDCIKDFCNIELNAIKKNKNKDLRRKSVTNGMFGGIPKFDQKVHNISVPRHRFGKRCPDIQCKIKICHDFKQMKAIKERKKRFKHQQTCIVKETDFDYGAIRFKR